MRCLHRFLPLSLLAPMIGCGYPPSVSGESVLNANGYPDGQPVRAYRTATCEGEEPGTEDDDGFRYYVFQDGDGLRLYEYTGPKSTYMTYYTNGWTKPGEDIFFVADELGGRTKAGQLFALPHDDSQGALAMYAGGRGGLKLKVVKMGDHYMASEDSTIIGAQCLERADDEPFPPKFAGPPPWAGFHQDDAAPAAE